MLRSVLALSLVFSCAVGLARGQEAAFSWNNATVYFLLTDRFENGDPSNDASYGRGTDPNGEAYPRGPGFFYGGDFRGITKQVEAGYFDALGVDAIWISPPFEQIHGWVGGDEGNAQMYAYHGYWPLDFTEVDANWGSRDDLAALVDACHKRGIRVVIDVVLNHAGYNTMTDMSEFDFGVVDSNWVSWRPRQQESWYTYNELFVDYAREPDAWASWWGPDWIRVEAAGYPTCGGDDLTRCLSYLPDFRTESRAEVDLPPVLVRKWGPEKTAHERASLDAFFRRTGLSRTPRNYLIKWITDWVRAFGIDGFRIDTAKHVEPETWLALKEEAVLAHREWQSAHPRVFPQPTSFWMTGEFWGHGVERSMLFDYGFDSVINFSFQRDVQGDTAHLDSVYSAYAHYLNDEAQFNVLSYISSHDTKLFRRDSLVEAVTRLLLAPGAVQLFYGDETARPPARDVSADDLSTRSAMNWDSVDQDVLERVKLVGAFRRRHRAIGAGSHQLLSMEPYVFGRILRSGATTDNVVVAMGAEGRTRLNVGKFFPDDSYVRDAVTGKSAFVSFGYITIEAGADGLMLLELAD